MAENGFLSLLQQAPTPHQAQKLTRGKLQKLLKEHRIRRLDASELQRILCQPVFPGVDPMAPPEAIEVKILVSQLQLVLSQIKDVERQMDALMQRWERTQTATPTHDRTRIRCVTWTFYVRSRASADAFRRCCCPKLQSRSNNEIIAR